MSAEKRKKRKKKKKHNPVSDYLTYLGMRLGVAIMHCFPVENNLRFAKKLGSLMWKHYHRGRDRALTNLHASFPEKDEQWIHATGQRSFQQIVMLVVDILFTPKLVRKDNWQQYSRFINAERIKWMMKEEKGLLLLTAHYGNFEIMGYMMGLFGFNIYSIARPLDNKFINNWLYGIRKRKGQKIIDKKGASAIMTQVVDEGATLGFIADQDAGKKGVFVDFFGRKASTYKSIGLMAIQYNLPIGVGCCRRVDDRFFFEMEVQRIITPDEWADKDDPLKWVTQEYSKAMENFIRKDPTQYWWLHRRWKHRPREERKKTARTG
ncbi:Lipid A biosynthesis lauroyl acyltransferase [Anaerohalosphaera lusitana]|uniref:Lipid A biosynthesis lauroyl acyltransferase n=1 Tax=Anaerohalosphaera lusitana TaxID=1936003 RepID=A0A1U9NLP6_9BACT|nr:lysophospholipid acyltransferase family protein [Anaerohalosphaera lusitana]AQT68658.1 Lipid A biosynthesis lauroyl acyltransferase [Anaerohalosphaera lusitana]